MEVEILKEEILHDAARREGRPVDESELIRTEPDRERDRKERILARNRAKNEQIKKAMLARRAMLAPEVVGGGGA